MPAKLIIKKTCYLDPPPVWSRGVWLRGEVVEVVETTQPLGSGEQPAAGYFVHFTVTDKTVAEMQQYLADYNRDINMQVIAGPDPSGLRRINVRNQNTNASGTVGGWDTETTDSIIAAWNAEHPACNLITIGIITGTNPSDTWQCEGTFTTGEAQEFSDTIIANGTRVLDRRKLWYITEAGMTNIEAAGGSQSGTAAQLGGILRDARLD